MQSSARTYTGNGKEYNFGDVISYANAGTHLINGNYAQGKICFFGIIESDYWTPEAKQMFEDCVGFVAMTCSSDLDCADEEIGDKYCSGDDVYQKIMDFQCENPGKANSQCVDDVVSEKIEECDYGCFQGECIRCNENSDCNDNNAGTIDTCNNPGTLASSCSNEGVKCSKKNDCGTDGLIGNLFCLGNGSYQDYIAFDCLNPGTSQSSCVNSTSQVLKQNCNLCIGGSCVGCLDDSDCPADFFETPYCSGKSVFNYFTDYSCVNYQCTSQRTSLLNKTCDSDEICVLGECKKIDCYNNYDCGINGFINGLFCENGNSKQDFQSFVCKNPGKVNSYCTDYTLPILMNYCEFQCISGDCYACFNDLSCGNNSFVDDKYCKGNSVYQDYKEFECLNPGTKNSDCLSSISEKWIKDCKQGEVCFSGECKKIKCYNDADCDDSNVSTVDECNHQGTLSSYCTNTPVNCVTNNDCGTTGFTGIEFCSQNNIFKNYQNSTCINGGTKQSYCDASLSSLFLIGCGIDSCDNWGNNYCIGNNSYHSRDCFDKGCLNGACFSQATTEEELVQKCAYGCANGQCTGECSVDLNCTADYLGNQYCIGKSVYMDSHDFSCVLGMCAENVITNLFQNCSLIDGCTNWSDNYCIGKQVFRGRACNFGSCDSGQCLVASADYLELVENCSGACVNGACVNITCYDDSDCGVGATFVPYCKGDERWYQSGGVKCISPGLINSSCQMQYQDNFDKDCGSDYCDAWNQNYCVGTQIYRNKTCYDKGCSNITKDCFNTPSLVSDYVGNCTQGCVNGACLNDTRVHDVALIGFTNSIGGIGLEYTNGTDILGNNAQLMCNQDYKILIKVENQGDYTENITFNGNVNGLLFSHVSVNNAVPGYVSSIKTRTVNFALPAGTYTINAAALIPIDNEPLDNLASRDIEIICPNCLINANCGNQFSNLICVGNNVTNSTVTPTCTGGNCLNITTNNFVISCPTGSCSGWGNNYCVGNQIYQNRTCSSGGCVPGGCISTISFQDKNTGNCTHGCSNGACVNITCSKDSDCGVGATFVPYCKLDERWINTGAVKCISPGLINSSCQMQYQDNFDKDCGSDYCDAWNSNYCVGTQIYRNKTCYNRGCSNITKDCFNNPSLVSDYVGNCTQGCVNGACINITCSNNTQCGISGFIGAYFCQTDDSYRNYQSFTCLNPGTAQSSCNLNVTDMLIGDCFKGCFLGKCLGC